MDTSESPMPVAESSSPSALSVSWSTFSSVMDRSLNWAKMDKNWSDSP